MSVINDLIRTEENGTLSFGNTELPAKAKLDGYEYNGDLYKICLLYTSPSPRDS